MIVERSALELNPISILNIRVKRVADTRINRLTRWLTDSVNHLFCEENMANSRDYRNPNYTEKIKLQRFFTQLQIAASFFKEHFVGKIMYYETEIESVELHFSPTNFGSSEYIVELLS